MSQAIAGGVGFDEIRSQGLSLLNSLAEKSSVEGFFAPVEASHRDPAIVEDATTEKLALLIHDLNKGSDLDSFTAPRHFLGIDPWKTTLEPAL